MQFSLFKKIFSTPNAANGTTATETAMYYDRAFAPGKITSLAPNEVFVFGSNLAGAHHGGAARIAHERFGAVWGEGVGHHGQSYAIPTMQGGVDTIEPYASQFIRYAKEHPQFTFLVTRIGCGIAGFKCEQIAPLFKEAIGVQNILLPKAFVHTIAPQQEPIQERKQEPEPDYHLERFLKAQEQSYSTALQEITLGQKRTHWIWYIFPQLTGLGRSANSQYYGISGRGEAEAYLRHPVLGKRLREITAALLTHSDKPAEDILGGIDAKKVRSCLTLFNAISPSDIFSRALTAFYHGRPDHHTLNRL